MKVLGWVVLFVIGAVILTCVQSCFDTDTRPPRGPLPSMFESDAIIPSEYRTDTAELAELGGTLTRFIRAHGWRCDTISGLVPMTRRRGYFVKCNGFMYAYEVVDRGGNWTVTLDD